MEIRTITVKGIGKASAKPDLVVLSMSMESHNMDYSKAMEMAAKSIEHLNTALATVGFEKDAVKTTSFDVRTDYDNVKDRYGNYSRKFDGYVVSHDLKVVFDFDMNRLAQALSAVADCLAHPQLRVSFTLKDPTALNAEMLRSATANAREKAEILCEASGEALGKLLSIDYNWGELNICSNTRFGVAEDCLAMPMAAPIDIEPDDIDVSDTATFVWEIK